MALDIELGELLRRAIESYKGDIWTSFPGKVVAFNPGSVNEAPTVDVAPVIQRPIPTGDEGEDVAWEELPVLPGIPVSYPRGGGDAFTITWPLQAGDWVSVHVSTYSFGNWRRTGSLADPPGDTRPHSLGNAWAVPGMSPNSAGLPQAGVNALVLKGNPTLLGDEHASDFVALASLVVQELQKIQTTLGTATAPSGGGAVTYGTPYVHGQVAAQKVKAT